MANLAFHGIALREYYINKYKWSSQTMDSKWWSIYYQSLSKLPDPDKLRIEKFVTNRWPTLHREQKYYNKSTTTSYCRQFKLHDETKDHIIRFRTHTRQPTGTNGGKRSELI
jgi:hypothetical protein